MAEQNVPGIEGIDTRELTKVIREEGTMLAKIVLDGDEEPELVDPNVRNLASEVSRTVVTPMGECEWPHAHRWCADVAPLTAEVETQ